MSAFFRYLGMLIGVAIVAGLAVFAVENIHTVSATFLNQGFTVHLWWIAIGAALAGLILGVLMMAPGRIDAGKRAIMYRQDIEQRDQELHNLQSEHERMVNERERLIAERERVRAASTAVAPSASQSTVRAPGAGMMAAHQQQLQQPRSAPPEQREQLPHVPPASTA
jgi:uncharacterized integral membrane protein